MTEYFSIKEIECNCGCASYILIPEFLQVMNDIRKAYGKPIYINRWYSCDSHDEELGGKGNHPTGKAADIGCLNSLARWELVSLAIEYGISRIGIGKTFLHFDIVQNAPQPRIWIYS